MRFLNLKYGISVFIYTQSNLVHFLSILFFSINIIIKIFQLIFYHLFFKSIKDKCRFLNFNMERYFKKIQPQYLSSGHRCGKGCFRINVLRLILIIQKNLSDFDKLNCLKSDDFFVNKYFKVDEFIIRLWNALLRNVTIREIIINMINNSELMVLGFWSWGGWFIYS